MFPQDYNLAIAISTKLNPVERGKGENSFFVNNVQGFNYSEEDMHSIVKGTKKYLLDKGVSFSVNYKYNENIELQGVEFNVVQTSN